MKFQPDCEFPKHKGFNPHLWLIRDEISATPNGAPEAGLFQSTSLINQRWNSRRLQQLHKPICFNPHLWLIRDEISQKQEDRHLRISFNPHLWLIRDEISIGADYPELEYSFNPHLWLIRDEIYEYADDREFMCGFNPHLWLIRDEISNGIEIMNKLHEFQSTSLINQRWNKNPNFPAPSSRFQSTSLINQRWNRFQFAHLCFRFVSIHISD